MEQCWEDDNEFRSHIRKAEMLVLSEMKVTNKTYFFYRANTLRLLFCMALQAISSCLQIPLY